MIKLNYAKASTHKECAYFNNGICILNNIPVDPNQVACPNFTPRYIVAMPQAAKAYLQTWQQGATDFASIPIGLRGKNMSRGVRMARRKGMGRGMGRFTPSTFPQTSVGTPTLSSHSVSKEQKIRKLESQMITLQQQLEQIKKQLQKL